MKNAIRVYARRIQSKIEFVILTGAKKLKADRIKSETLKVHYVCPQGTERKNMEKLAKILIQRICIEICFYRKIFFLQCGGVMQIID